MDNQKDNGKLIAGLLLGIAAGAGLALLFAPSKGSELRDKIKRKASELADELQETFAKNNNAGKENAGS